MTSNHAGLATIEPLAHDGGHSADNGARQAGNAIIIDTRFGRFSFDPDSVLRLPNGLPGFLHEREFALASFPDARLRGFKLLQSLERPDLSFIVVPLGTDNGMIQPQDVTEVLDNLSIDGEDAAFLLIVTVRNDPDHGVLATCNLRAPLVVDTRTRTAHQYVLRNDDYPIQHPLAIN